MNFDNMFGMSGMFDGMCRKVGSDMCRLTMILQFVEFSLIAKCIMLM